MPCRDGASLRTISNAPLPPEQIRVDFFESGRLVKGDGSFAQDVLPLLIECELIKVHLGTKGVLEVDALKAVLQKKW